MQATQELIPVVIIARSDTLSVSVTDRQLETLVRGKRTTNTDRENESILFSILYSMNIVHSILQLHALG